MKTTSPILFNFGENLIRTAVDNGNILFCAKDTCAALGLEQTSRAIESLRDEEKITLTNSNPNPRAGIPHQMIYINEPGLYRLIFKSRKAEAVIFQDWVFNEVLPQIRKTGSYTKDHSAYLNLIRDQIALGVHPDIAAKGACKLVGSNMRAIPVTHPANPINADLQDLIDLIEPGKHYGIPELALALPTGHHLKQLTEKARDSRVGNILNAGILSGHLERHIKNRRKFYSLRTVIPFEAAES
jgi:hypothetical protein